MQPWSLLVAPVPLEHLGTVAHDLADRIRRQFSECFRIDDARVGIENRNAETLPLRTVDGIDVRRRDRLRESVTFDIRRTNELLQPFAHRRRHRCAAARSRD